MHNYIFDAATNGLLLQAEDINPVACRETRSVYAEEMDLLGFGLMCVKHLAEFFGTEEHVLRAKIEELKDNNCPLFR